MVRLSAAPVEIDSYERFVAECAKAEREPSQLIYNKNVTHTTILIKHLIRRARSHIRILSGWLDEAVYVDSELMVAMKEFLARNGDVRVLVDFQPPRKGIVPTEAGELFHTNSFVRALKSSLTSPDQLRVCTVPLDVVPRYGYHLIVGDDDVFRFEEDRNKVDAVAQFGNTELASKLATRFDEIWGLSVR